MSPADLFRRLQRRLRALLCAVLVATVCTHALSPVTAPLERVHGSAFSAATDDVALGQVRRGEAARMVAAVVPLTISMVAAVAPPAATRLARPPLARPRSTGPPPFPWLPPRTGPRAPPRP